MLKETKIGEAVIVEQTTYYYYASEEDRKNDKYVFCTSDRNKMNQTKRNLRSFFKKLQKNKDK